jgi:hypothetical protein
VEEAAFLVAVQGIVSGIEIEDDRLRRCLVRLEKEIDEQALDRRRGVPDLVVAARSRRRVLQPVQGAFAGQRGAVFAPGRELAGERCKHRVVAQLIVVDKVLVAERDAEHALRDHGGHAVLDLPRRPAIIEAVGKPVHEPDRPIGRAEQQPAGIRRDRAAVEGGDHLAALDHFIPKQIAATLRRHRGAPLLRVNSLSQKNYRRFRAPMHLSSVRNPG